MSKKKKYWKKFLKMRVVLVQPPHEYEHETRTPAHFPIGLGYIARILLEAGHNVSILDIYAKQYTKKKVAEIIPYLDYDVIGISAYSTQYSYMKWLTKELKNHHKKPIVIGGPLATFSSEIVLKHTDADFCIIGEGEITFLELINNIDESETVDGISYKKNDKIITNKPREYIKNLDDVLLPAWELFPIETYLNTPVSQEGYSKKSMNIISSRGCPYNCVYCSKTFSGLRMRSVDNIIKEIKELKKRYGVGVIDFTEELLMVSKERMKELCDKIRPLKIKWTCQGRVNVVDEEMLRWMKEAGCVDIGYGIESGSQKILNNMNKGVRVEQAERAIQLILKVGIRPTIQMMFGFSGEDEQTIKETIDFCNRNHIQPSTEFFITTPLPGTPLYDTALKEGLIKDEEEYLEKLTGCSELLVNFTNFSNEKFLELKKETERIIQKNYSEYRRRHPRILIRDYLYKLRRGYLYARKYGIVKTAKDVVNALRTNPTLIFQAEYS